MGPDVQGSTNFRSARLNLEKLGGSKGSRPSLEQSTTIASTSVGAPVLAHDPTGSSNGDKVHGRRGRGGLSNELAGVDKWFRHFMEKFSKNLRVGRLQNASSTRKHQERRQQRQQKEGPQPDDPLPGDIEMNFEYLGCSLEVFYSAPGNDFAGGRLDDGESGEDVDGDREGPLYPGVYRALYGFKPEGTAEMRLTEGQLVQVVGRGSGVGWAVVVVSNRVDSSAGAEEGVRYALVPEKYLEVVELD